MDTIVGTWRLVRAAATAADGSPLPPPYGGQGMGRVTFNTDGRMMAVLCDGRPSLPERAVRDTTPTAAASGLTARGSSPASTPPPIRHASAPTRCATCLSRVH
jgi:Lipocalin-like domain